MFWGDLEGAGTLCPTPHSSYIQKPHTIRVKDWNFEFRNFTHIFSIFSVGVKKPDFTEFFFNWVAQQNISSFKNN